VESLGWRRRDTSSRAHQSDGGDSEKMVSEREMALSTPLRTSWQPCGRVGCWQVRPTATYGHHGSKHAAAPASSSPLTLPSFSLKPD
jgi:hypothetical protein